MRAADVDSVGVRGLGGRVRGIGRHVVGTVCAGLALLGGVKGQGMYSGA